MPAMLAAFVVHGNAARASETRSSFGVDDDELVLWSGGYYNDIDVNLPNSTFPHAPRITLKDGALDDTDQTVDSILAELGIEHVANPDRGPQEVPDVDMIDLVLALDGGACDVTADTFQRPSPQTPVYGVETVNCQATGVALQARSWLTETVLTPPVSADRVTLDVTTSDYPRPKTRHARLSITVNGRTAVRSFDFADHYVWLR
jgi:hypothetical protein